MTRTLKDRAIRWVTATCAGLFCLGLCRVGHATDVPSPANVTEANLPFVQLSKTGGTPQNWTVENNGLGGREFTIRDLSAGQFPVVIDPGAISNSIRIVASGRVGMGISTPDINTKLDIRSTGLLYGFLVRRSDAGSHYARMENPAGAFRLGVQSNGDAQLGALTANKQLTLLAGGTSKMVINASGQFSFGNPPPAFGADALTTSTGAVLTTGGVWTSVSSRAAKQDIEPITSDEARETVRALQPVGFRYKAELDERYVGFIAEDVPDLVATRNRKGLAPMDIVGVLTKVVQDQDRELAAERATNASQQKLIAELSERLLKLEQKVNE